MAWRVSWLVMPRAHCLFSFRITSTDTELSLNFSLFIGSKADTLLWTLNSGQNKEIPKEYNIRSAITLKEKIWGRWERKDMKLYAK